MTFFKKLWEKLKAPKIWFVILYDILFLGVLAGTIILVVLEQQQSIWHYLLYILAALTLTYFVYTIIYVIPFIKAKIIATMKKHKFTNSLLENYGYRTLVFSVFSFIINIAYVTLIAVPAIMAGSVWYITIASYYLLLILMKGNIFYSKKRYNTPVKQARAYRYCGIMFILLTLAFSGIIVLIYTSNMYFEYAGLMIYVVAVFTFYKLVLAIYNIFKSKQQDDLYVQSIRNVNLISALVSVVVLQVAMIQEFSPENNTSIANALTGAGISAIILVIAILMIVKANKKLKQLNITQNLENLENTNEEQK